MTDNLASAFTSNIQSLHANVNLDFSKQPRLEGIREWIVLVLATVLIILCLRAAYRIFKTRGIVSFDCIIVFCEAIRVSFIGTHSSFS